jgi:hypothetical protein
VNKKNGKNEKATEEKLGAAIHDTMEATHSRIGRVAIDFILAEDGTEEQHVAYHALEDAVNTHLDVLSVHDAFAETHAEPTTPTPKFAEIHRLRVRERNGKAPLQLPPKPVEACS